MKSKIDVDHISTLAHLESTKEERRLLVSRMIKTVEWLDRLEELELDLSKGEVYSPAFGNSGYGKFFSRI